MLPGRTPKRLHDVSHLFLSKHDSSNARIVSRVEAAVWLVVHGDSLNRAYLAAGIATAFAGHGIHVTMYELESGLPNVGYYFALEPEEYLALTLDKSSVISGESGASIRYSIVREAKQFSEDRIKTPPVDSPHVILTALTCPRKKLNATFFTELGKHTSCRGGRGKRPISLDGVMFCTDGGRPELNRTITSLLTETYPQAILFVAGPDGKTCSGSGADEAVTIPPGFGSTWVKRVPPADPFFGDFTANFLQVLSHRRRKALSDAAG